MKANDPEAWEDACFVDEQLRAAGIIGYMTKMEYMHRSLLPLRTANLGDEKTIDMFGNECEGMCGV